MILSDGQIQTYVEQGGLDIEPYYPSCYLQPASYDLRLDRHFRRFRKGGAGPTRLVDPALDEDHTEYFRAGEKFGMEPHDFLLASTVERVRLPTDLVGRIEGKSSLARLGLFVHVTAGFVDPGFNGFITLELYCANPRGIWLYPGMPIAQIAFERLGAHAASPYGADGRDSKYQDSVEPGPVPSRYHMNFPIEELPDEA